MDNRLYVAYCFDERYVMPTLASATSLLNKTPSAVLFLFYRSVQQVTLKFLELALRDVHPAAELRFRSLEGYDWASKGYGSHLQHTSSCTNDRLVIPEILEKTDPEVERLLYIDGDTIVFADLSKYVKDIQLPKSGVAARRVGSIRSKVWGHGLAGGSSLSRSTPALNAGILVFDLKLLKANGFAEFCQKVLKNRPSNDQSLLNLYCHGCFARLPPEMNMFVSEVGKPGFKTPCILHCAGQSLKFWAPPGTAGSDRYGALWRSLLPTPQRHAVLASMARQQNTEQKQDDNTTTTTTVSLDSKESTNNSIEVAMPPPAAAPKRRGRKPAVPTTMNGV